MCALYESEHGPSFFERIFFDRPSYRSLFESLTFEEASRGNVVIVGRGAQIILRDMPGIFKVRIVAPFEERVTRIMERLGLSKTEATKYVREYDHERRSLMTAIFEHSPTDWALFDLVLNTACYDSGSAAEVVMKGVEMKAKGEDEKQLLDTLKNLSVAKRIEGLIRKKMTSVVARNVEVAAQSDGKVTLSGRIRTPEEKKRAEKIASDYPGVTSVQNDLKVTELSFRLY